MAYALFTWPKMLRFWRSRAVWALLVTVLVFAGNFTAPAHATTAPVSTYTLTVSKGTLVYATMVGGTLAHSTTGTGTIRDNTGSIVCGKFCTAKYLAGTTVTLTAQADVGSQFRNEWAGCTSVAGFTCSVVMNSNVTVEATFDLIPTSYLLYAAGGGTGSGTISSNPAGVSCSSSCYAPFAANSSVVLTAQPLAGSAFAGWSGDCVGTGTCTVLMNQERSVVATFALLPVILTVTTAGRGTGVVQGAGSAGAINCSGSCVAAVAIGSSLSLTAQSSIGSAFVGWSTNPAGYCSGNAATCTLAMPSTAVTVTATFNRLPVAWGAYVGDQTTDAATFENLVGHQMNMQVVFVGWGASNPFPAQYAPTVRDVGKTLVVFWEQTGTTLDNITAGNSDTYISQFAATAQSYGGPIILAPFAEMNGNWDSWGGTVGTNTPAKVIAAWQHVHNLFAGVTNVKFAWDVNSTSVPNTTANAITAYYPGDAYVDYVAVDGFNFGSPWQTFDQVFGSALATLKNYGKPVYILSMASAPGTQKAAWITDAFSVQVPLHSEVVGWVWFNQLKEKNWRVNSDANSLVAFKAILP